MRIFNITGESLPSEIEIVPGSLNVLTGGTYRQREAVVHGLLLHETDLRFTACGFTRAKKRPLVSLPVSADYENAIPAFEIGQTLKMSDCVGDSINLDKNLLSMLSSHIRFRCCSCDKELNNSYQENFSFNITEQVDFDKIESTRCFFFARVDDVISKTSDTQQTKNASSLLSYIIASGYKRVALHESKDSLRNPSLILRKISNDTNFEDRLQNIITIDVLLDSYSAKYLTEERLRHNYNRLMNLGISHGVFIIIHTHSDKIENFHFGHFLYCSHCEKIYPKQIDRQRIAFHQLSIENNEYYPCINTENLYNLLKLPFEKWHGWIHSILHKTALENPKESQNSYELVYKLQSLVFLKLGHLTYSRQISSLSSGEQFKLALIATLNVNFLAIIIEPSIFIHKDDYDDILKYIRVAIQKGITLLVSESKHVNEQVAFSRNTEHVISFSESPSSAHKSTLSALQKTKRITSDDIIRNKTRNQISIIYGPTGAGKSRLLKQVAVLASNGQFLSHSGRTFTKAVYLPWKRDLRSYKGKLLAHLANIRNFLDCYASQNTSYTSDKILEKPISDLLNTFHFPKNISNILKPYVQLGLGHLYLNTPMRCLSADEELIIRIVKTLWDTWNGVIFVAFDQSFQCMEDSIAEFFFNKIHKLGKDKIEVFISTNDKNIATYRAEAELFELAMPCPGHTKDTA